MRFVVTTKIGSASAAEKIDKRCRPVIIQSLGYTDIPYYCWFIVVLEIFSSVPARIKSKNQFNEFTAIFQLLGIDKAGQDGFNNGILRAKFVKMCFAKSIVLSYQVDTPYEASAEVSINPFDKDLHIHWPNLCSYILSDRDRDGISFSSFAKVHGLKN